MRHPPYHLRPNKAVDRFILMEAIRKLERLDDLSAYAYYGFGGPYLEEFRLLYEFFPNLRMVSIEKHADTFARQQFHLPCGRVRLERTDFRSFLARYEGSHEKSIFWLDFTELKVGVFDDLKALLAKVATGSLVKVSVPAEPEKYIGKAGEFRARFGEFMQISSSAPPRSREGFAALLQDMFRVAAQQALPAVGETFQPLTSAWYADGAGMFTLTGMVCGSSERVAVRDLFRKWPLARLNWGTPCRIDVPILSTKERLHLQRHLPCEQYAARRLQKLLGYPIEGKKSALKLKQYSDFHRYFPYFMKAVP